MNTGTPTSGRNSVVRVGTAGNVFEGMDWDVEEKATTYDSTSFEDNGFEDEDAATTGCEVTVKGLWDQTRNPHLDPLSLNAGNTVQNLKLYIYGLTGPFWYFPKALVTGDGTNAKPKEGIPVTITFKSKGKYARPGESIGNADATHFRLLP